MTDVAALKERFNSAGQGHVFAYYDTLSPVDQASLLNQLSTIDPARVNDFYTKAIAANERAKSESADDISPLPQDVLESLVPSGDVSSDAEISKRIEGHRERGLEAIAEGKVAVLLMAGGQGTRLGSADPKGCYDIQLPSHKSLFQLQAERIKSLQRVAAVRKGKKEGEVRIRWYVMTSAPTHEKTRAFFGWGPNGEKIGNKGKVNFGLDEDQVVFFQQGILPCLDPTGKILLETPSKVAVAPDGNGGLYAALRKPLTVAQNNLDAPSILSDFATRGITHIHTYCVDNCLVRVADPVFLGTGLAHKSDCAAKTVPKIDPHESVGVVAMKNGKYVVVEYSEITQEMAERRENGNGKLAFRAGNIVNHLYTRDFLERTEEMESALAHHVARKKIPSIPVSPSPSQSGNLSPAQEKRDGLKLELFVFDVFPFSTSFLVVEVPRAEDFSPLKNAPGSKSDCPETSRFDLLAQQRRWLETAGAKLQEGVEIEVSPLVSYAGEGLESVNGFTFTKSGVVESVEDFKKLV